MEYLLEGLQGKADTSKAGNGDGKVSLLEMYRFASDQTKNYVATAYNSLQTPVLKGEITNDFDIGTKIHWDKIVVPDDFKTIGQAMAAAGDGTTILVQPGRYEGSIVLKSGVKLFGVDKEKVVVSARTTALIAHNCTSGEVRNMTFEGERHSEESFYNIVGIQNSRISLADCIVRSEDNRRFGIVCGDHDKSTISRCLVEMCSDGIYVVGEGTEVVLQQNTCRRNEYHGIQINEGAAAEARFCTCRNNKQDGIYVNNKQSRAVLRDNECRDNGINGIEATDAPGWTRINHCLANKTGSGIYVQGPKLRRTCSITKRSTMATMAFSRTRAERSPPAIIVASTTSRPGSASSKQLSTSNRIIAGSTKSTGLRGKGRHGHRCEQPLRSQCWPRDCRPWQRGTAKIDGNECHSNNGGITIYSDATATIQNNRCSRNKYSGLETSAAGIRAENNTFADNVQCGIIVFSSNAVLLRNDCLHNSVSGISLRKGSTGEVRGNRCHNNIKNGIYFGAGSTAAGENDNSLQGNGADAVYHSTTEP